jgi:hypothetical protein
MPDMRYSINKEKFGYHDDVPLRLDGMPDMRYSVNKNTYGGSFSSSSNTVGPLR